MTIEEFGTLKQGDRVMCVSGEDVGEALVAYCGFAFGEWLVRVVMLRESCTSHSIYAGSAFRWTLIPDPNAARIADLEAQVERVRKVEQDARMYLHTTVGASSNLYARGVARLADELTDALNNPQAGGKR